MTTGATPRLVLVGAGPGDPELITLKGLKAIKQAHVILYDALAAEELLAHASADCKLIPVGKRKGRHSFPQDEINQLIVFYAYRCGTVVRLKGGDPFVFGRGSEEIEYARRRGIETEVIPGISSAIAGPAAAGIPATQRGVCESFWVVTGTMADGSMASDLKLAAQSTATVIVLMGMHNLMAISELFAHYRGPMEPAAIIQNATRPDQQQVVGTTSDLPELASQSGLKAPAIVVIGKVVDSAAVLNFCSGEESRVVI